MLLRNFCLGEFNSPCKNLEGLLFEFVPEWIHSNKYGLRPRCGKRLRFLGWAPEQCWPSDISVKVVKVVMRGACHVSAAWRFSWQLCLSMSKRHVNGCVASVKAGHVVPFYSTRKISHNLGKKNWEFDFIFHFQKSPDIILGWTVSNVKGINFNPAWVWPKKTPTKLSMNKTRWQVLNYKKLGFPLLTIRYACSSKTSSSAIISG